MGGGRVVHDAYRTQAALGAEGSTAFRPGRGELQTPASVDPEDATGRCGAISSSPSRPRVRAISQDDCMRISVSILTPMAFSMRNAIIPDRFDRPFRNFESAGRDTPIGGRWGLGLKMG